ncbi:unnamed protein product [Withania somnifera]
MGAQDMERQALNVFRMRLLGAEVRAVHSGTATLKDATTEAIRDWVTNVEITHYILGSVAGPHPYPMMVREFHAVIGKETRKQSLEKWGGKTDVLVACVGGGSNAMGLFHEFVDDKDVRLIGVEAAGFGLDSGKHAATLTKGEVGVLHGAMGYLLQDEDGQIVEPHSISAGLDYPGVRPEHSFLKDLGRAEYYSITDEETLEAFKALSRLEGIIPALETSHALAYLEKLCPTLPNGTKVVLNCNGRGDKDVQTAIKYLKVRWVKLGPKGSLYLEGISVLWQNKFCKFNEDFCQKFSCSSCMYPSPVTWFLSVFFPPEKNVLFLYKIH